MRQLDNYVPGNIAKKLRFLQQLNYVLLDCLPIEYLSHVRVTALEQNVLKLAADSPVWASKMRYQSKDIAKAFSIKSGLTVNSIKLSISPAVTDTASKPRKKPRLSQESAKHCKTLAASIEHPSLKEALLKLSERTGKN